MIILKRLEKIKQRMQKIEQELSDPSAIKDQNKYQKLTKELAEVRPIVQTFDAGVNRLTMWYWTKILHTIDL